LQRLKLNYEKALSNRAFNFMLRRYCEVQQEQLPFELVALEVALEIVCHCLEAEQREVRPAGYCSPRHAFIFFYNVHRAPGRFTW